MSERYILSDITLEFNGLSEENSAFLNYVCGVVKLGSESRACFTYNREEYIGEKILPVCTRLKSGNYYTDLENNEIVADFYNGERAQWDFNQKVFSYFTNKCNLSSPRNWFFMDVLDPYSIACLDHNKLVVHGALWDHHNEAILVLGASGTGKSTLSYLMQNRIDVLADDVAVLTFLKDCVVAEPVDVGMGLLKK